MGGRPRFSGALAGAILAAALACANASQIARAGAPQVASGLDYAGDGTDAHRLDLYLPQDPHSTAIVIFIHGGAFMQGTRQGYAEVGRAFALQGIPTAVVSYRLYPQSDAGGACRDVALATMWMIRHAGAYGLEAHNVFLVGHSAGAQIAAVIGTDPQYLNGAGGSIGAIRGIFAVAGAYDVRDLSGEPDSWQRLDGHIYGETPQARGAFSPAIHVDPHSPPTVTACGTQDDPDSCGRALRFAAALRAAGIAATTIQESGADHMGMLRALIDPKDPLNEALHYFIAKEI